MLAHASLEKEAIVVGLGSTIEIWNPEIYEDYLIKDSEEYSELAQRFLDE